MQTMNQRHERFVKEMRKESPHLPEMAAAMFDWLREKPPHNERHSEERAATLPERHRQFAARMRREACDPGQLQEGVLYTAYIGEERDDDDLEEELEKAFNKMFDELFGPPKKKIRRKRPFR